MKFPQSPPAWQPLLDRVIQQGKADVFMEFSHQENLKEERYLHWDDFRHRVSDRDGLTKEEQWAAIRMGRAMRSQPIPLADARGRAFTFFLTPKAFGRLREIDLHCGIGPSDSAMVREETSRHQFDSLMEEALTSSQLEGAVVTRSEAREMIRSQRPPATGHERMVMNNYRTMRLLTELKEKPLTPGVILRIHREVTAGTLKDPTHEGQFRNGEDDVRVEDEESGEVFHTPPAAELLGGRIGMLCDFANEQGMNGFLHPVIRSILLHFWIAYDHPFVDGNGRTARALFYWSMLRNGYWLAEYFSISHEILKAPKQYYRAFLHTETDGNDLNYFLLHQLDAIGSSIDSLRESIRGKQEEAETLRRNLGAGSDFNHRQIALLKHALKHPFASYTVVGHQNSHGTSNQTAKNDLTALEMKGLLQRGKVGQGFRLQPGHGSGGKTGFVIPAHTLAGCSFHQFAVQADFGDGAGFVIDAFEEKFRRGLADGFGGLPDHGHGRIDEAGPGRVVEGGETDVFGDADATLRQGFIGPGGDQRAAAKHGVHGGLEFEDFIDQTLAFLLERGDLEHPGDFFRLAAEGFAETADALGRGVTFRAENPGDVLETAIDERAGEFVGGFKVVDDHRVEAGIGELAVEEHHRRCVFPEFLQVLHAGAGGGKQDAGDFFLAHEFEETRFFLRVFVGVADEHAVAGFHRHGFDGAADFAEKRVSDVGKQQPDHVGFLRPQVACDAVGPVAERFGGGFHLRPGVVADVALARQNARNGGDGNAGFFRDVFD